MPSTKVELRNRWMRVSHRSGEPEVAWAAADGCYGGVISALRKVPQVKRKRLVRDFFASLENGKKLGYLAADLVVLDFDRRAPLTKLARPVTDHLTRLGLEPALVEEVPARGARDIDPDWANSYIRYQQEPPSVGPLAEFLRRAVEAAVVAVPRTTVGMIVAREVPLGLVLHRAWGLVSGQDSPWDPLADVVLMGWVPVGLSTDRAFLVAPLEERGADRG